MLDLRRLRYFVAIERCGSMLLASRTLGVAQPALSRHIRELEATVGFQVLERLPRGVRVTDPGQILLHHAKAILAEVERAEAAIRSFSGVQDSRRVLKLGLLPSWSVSFTPAIVSAIATRLPGICLQIVEARHEVSLRMLADREIDLAVTLSTGDDASGREIVEEDLLLVSRDRLPASIPFGAVLRERDLILPKHENPLRITIERAAAALSLRPRVKIEIDGQDTVKRAVAAGLGDSILSWNSVRLECDGGLLNAAAIVEPPLKRRIYMRHDARVEDELADAFLIVLRGLQVAAAKGE